MQTCCRYLGVAAPTTAPLSPIIAYQRRGRGSSHKLRWKAMRNFFVRSEKIKLSLIHSYQCINLLTTMDWQHSSCISWYMIQFCLSACLLSLVDHTMTPIIIDRFWKLLNSSLYHFTWNTFLISGLIIYVICITYYYTFTYNRFYYTISRY